MATREKTGYGVLAGMWPDFVGSRWEGPYGRFVEDTLRRFGCLTVLNAALGDGCDTINLLKLGFEVNSNEIDEGFVRIASGNAQKQGLRPEITRWDWRVLAENTPAATYDAVILLGNSLTHLFSREDRMKALKGFLHVLRPGGALIIDERNYQRWLDGKEEMEGKALPKTTTYCGEKVVAFREKISGEAVTIRWAHEDGRAGTLDLYPFRKGEMLSELREAGFIITERRSDHMPGYSGEAEFYQYVAMKPFKILA